jgi:hypothetical protein
MAFGGLLSFVRSPDGSLNPFDYDYDLMVFRDDLERVLALKKTFVHLGFQIELTGTPTILVTYSSPDNIHRTSLDIFIASESERRFIGPFTRGLFSGCM